VILRLLAFDGTNQLWIATHAMRSIYFTLAHFRADCVLCTTVRCAASGPGADVDGLSPVPVQARWAQSLRWLHTLHAQHCAELRRPPPSLVSARAHPSRKDGWAVAFISQAALR
jgi:hypothetical protein